jgi:hypothetical protein
MAILATILSVVATVVAVVAILVVLARDTDPDPAPQAGTAGPDVCRTVTWSALPSAAALPPGWTVASTRFLVGILTATIVGPAPSDSTTQGPAAFVSVTCYGSDAGQALALDHAAALVSGATDTSFPKLGDESLAVTSTRTGSTTVYIRRGILVADLEAATSVDPAAFETVARAVDEAMKLALSGSGGPLSTATTSGGATPTPAASLAVTPNPSPSPSATPVSHLAPDLEGRLPNSVDGTAMLIDSVTGATALGTDPTSTALIAWLEDRGKTSSDLEIGRARDLAGNKPIRLYVFRVDGVAPADLARAMVAAFRADTTSSPTESEVTLAGRKVTKVTYGQGPAEYLFEAPGGVVFDIETTDESLVSKVLPLLE